MEKDPRLYERAAATQPPPASIMHMDEGRALWVSTTGFLSSHNGGAPVYLAGLHGKFRLRTRGGDWRLCRAAVIPPGLWHELDFHGEPFAALYLEPNVGGSDRLIGLLREKEAVDGVVVGAPDQTELLRTLYECPDSERFVEDELASLLRFSTRKANAASVDPRVRAVVEFLHANCDDLTPVSELARAVGLSASRFQHLFSAQLGAPFRRYRAWNRLRSAWRGISKGETITAAALDAGFFDSAHFAHEFRKTFGATASPNLKRAVRISPATARLFEKRAPE